MACSLLLSGAAEAASPLSISWVSTDRNVFDPDKGERVALRFRVSGPANVVVRWLDPYDRPARRVDLAVRRAGDQQVVWDGRDDAGNPVPPEAYVYTITAAPLASTGVRPSPPGSISVGTHGRAPLQTADSPIHPLTDSPDLVTYDLRGRTGGETVWPQDPFLDSGGRVTYQLPRPSRVRIIVSRKDATWPIRTLVDWEPRETGRHEEVWNGWDAGWFVNALKTPNLAPILYAYALPENSVIVKGTPLAAPSYARTPPPIHRFTDSSIQRSSIHVHARHPRERCYDPGITVSLPEVKEFAAAPPSSSPSPLTGEGRGGGDRVGAQFIAPASDAASHGRATLSPEVLRGPAPVPKITRPTPLRLDIAREQPPGKEFPIPRVSVFIYVDGVMVERFLVGYMPFNWIIDPAKLSPGERVITGLVAWRDDHFGIAHVRVWVEGEQKTVKR